MRIPKFILALAIIAAIPAGAQTTRLQEGWRFAFGNAADHGKDFGSGTEYFNYLTKANSIHSEGPYVYKFDDSSWQEVTVPHDWVTTLPYAPEASKSHGYKTVGWKYPETSVGWYRLKMDFPKDNGRHYELRFDGIFRDATVWFNGYYMGTEPSGYAVQTYDITPYINFGGENLLCVRVDATLEEGWFYEGAGIYRNAWLVESGLIYPIQGGTFTTWKDGVLKVSAQFGCGRKKATLEKIRFRLLDADGNELGLTEALLTAYPEDTKTVTANLTLENPHLWDIDDPYLYTLETRIGTNVYTTPVGIRSAEFNATDGFLLNGRKITLKGVNLHQDHAGVGAAMPDGLIEWRVRELKKIGVNAIRCSHNPATPALLDICDRLGVLIIDENRLMGINAEHKRLLENMVRWGRQHPCVVLWSIGNEEWGLENDPRGSKVARQMQDYVHLLDPTRQTTLANAGGGVMFQEADVKGYNYIRQNDVEGRHARHPEWIAYGSEETTGCGTRGVYFPSDGRMPSLNRTDSPENVIERGWQYYRDNIWTGGAFFWTGIDYRGEPWPLEYPTHDSEFGITDYCGFWKDEAWYLKAAWTSEPIVHILPHWNLEGHEGETIDIWVYSNCDEVKLTVNGKNLGRKKMPADGHLSWQAKYKKGKVVAEGYRKGKRVVKEVVETAGEAVSLATSCQRIGDITVVNVELRDKKGRFVPNARPYLTLKVGGSGHIIGAGNGDPAYMGPDNPGTVDCKEFSIYAFNGRAQFIIQGEMGTLQLSNNPHADGRL
ncbi:MAG: DUF4982 domain-containing protein [Bacteroidales bacterium]|nr:DUF4982 domain-containing protein [Bacteroidales bacterium]